MKKTFLSNNKNSLLIILIITIGASVGISYANTSNPFTAPYQVIDSNGNVTRMVIDSSGNVGIKTNTPQALLDVNGGVITRSQVPAISFMGDISGARWMQGLGNYMLSFYSDNSNQNGLGGTISYNGETWIPKVEFDPGGNLYTAGKIGIGTTTPLTKLDLGTNPSIFLEGNSNQWGFFINSTDYGSGNVPLTFTSRGGSVNSEVMRITHDGNVGIGTTSPAQKLDVNGNIKVNGNLTSASTNEFKITAPSGVPICIGSGC